MKLVCMPGEDGYIEPGSPEYDQVLGCSQIADILGVGYRSANELWMQKTHRAPATEHKAVFDRGHRMEAVMAEMVVDQYGRMLKSEQVQYRDPDRPWLIFHADGMFPKHCPLSSGEEKLEGPGIWEAKAPGMRMVDTMSRDGITENYLCQGQMGMHVASAALDMPITWATFGFLDYDAWELVAIDCKRSNEFLDAALAKVDEFWACVQSDTPPTPINGPLLPVPGLDMGTLVEVDKQVVEWAHDLAALIPALKEAKAQDTFIRDNIKAHMELHEKMEIPGVMSFSYKYGKAREAIDGKGLLVYCESLVEEFNALAGNHTTNIVFDRTQWCEPKPPTRTLRLKVIGE